MRLRPFFPFFGSKWRTVSLYPSPQHQTIVEPFAGSASYSVVHHDRNVILYDADPCIIGTWDYLIKVSPSDILRLPNIGVHDHLDYLPRLCQEERWLIGWWLNKATAHPCSTSSKWALEYPKQFWGPEIRKRIASQVDCIRHWRVFNDDYSQCPPIEATWFIDPPYSEAGKSYRNGSALISYRDLGRWCIRREGQVIVCENSGAKWLPFSHLAQTKANSSNGKANVSHEVIYARA